jgi:hypothetical protein
LRTHGCGARERRGAVSPRGARAQPVLPLDPNAWFCWQDARNLRHALVAPSLGLGRVAVGRFERYREVLSGGFIRVRRVLNRDSWLSIGPTHAN